MDWKLKLGLAAISFIAGVSLSTFVVDREGQEVSPGQVANEAAASSDTKDAWAIRAALEQQISRLEEENAALRMQISEGKDNPSRRRTHAELVASSEDLMKRRAAALKQQDIESLLAAGYSMDRIEQLWSLSEQLQERRRQEETDRRMRGLPVDSAKELAWFYGNDIELRYEIGDSEYEKYLEALGRPSSVAVTQVFPGSIAASVGIQPGDKIVGYNNRRIFNMGELLAMGTETRTANGRYLVEVERDGEILKIPVPGGSLGIKSHTPVIR